MNEEEQERLLGYVNEAQKAMMDAIRKSLEPHHADVPKHCGTPQCSCMLSRLALLAILQSAQMQARLAIENGAVSREEFGAMRREFLGAELEEAN